ncbi:MAG: DUF805 domain-containing protein [Bacteroidetes bacterium]|nr:DUF805 domain-containing protein [Bacteroidota bacterium]
MHAFVDFWKNYAKFSGRTSRYDFWTAWLLNLLLFLILHEIRFLPYVYIIDNLLSWLLILPGLAIGFRRMHDLEKPGWYFLIPVYGFILSTLSGNPRRNKYGQDPKLERLYEREKADYHLFL